MTTAGQAQNDSLKSRVLVLLRGALAQPRAEEDDPFDRVILSGAAGAPSPAALRIDMTSASETDESIRKRFDDAIAGYRTARSAAPDTVALPGIGVFDVRQDSAAPRLPLANKTAVVTGAAGAIGAGVCRGLLGAGCRVAATDISPERLAELAAELDREFPGRVAGVAMDVTSPAGVAESLGKVVALWGGVDIVIVNAGIAMVAGLLEMDVEAFRRLEKVNIEGTLNTLAESGRLMKRQGTGGDVIVISTKNVFAPGAQFGAYSATKAACHQLARIASLEMAPFGVRVNMVAPDAVFGDGQRRSGLWAEVGPSRMKARGLDEKGLEEYYRGRNLLKARVTPVHVANAVLFFATRQTPTTGATIPVDGGLPDATPR